MKSDALKKNHFWILLGLIPLLVLIAVLMITSGVGAKISQVQTEIDKQKSELNSKSSPKPGGLLVNLDKQIDKLKVKRTDLWKENWERSIGVSLKQEEGKEPELVQDPSRNLLRWPNSSKLTRFNYTTAYATDPNQLKFGDEIVPQNQDQGEYNEFKKEEIYLAEFSSSYKTGMADKVAPTTFLNGWQRVLRHVAMSQNGPNGWGNTRPTSEQLWLALEDIWIQRAMLGQITAVNKQLAAFAPIPRVGSDGRNLPDSKLERDFQSRIWRVALKVTPRESDGKYVMSGTLTNVTDRLQLMGVGNVMVLNVWLSSDPNAKPWKFRIGGEFVPGRGSGKETLKIEPSNDHVIPAGIIPTEIARVEQEFDTRTVPIRRIDRLVLGYRDSRHALKPLEMPKFKKFQEAAPADATAGGFDPMSAGPMPGVGSAGPIPGGIPGAGGIPGMEGAQSTSLLEGGGTAEAVLDGNKKRYVVCTDQVRRMPVAVRLVVDQSYIQDVLLAYANCPLRFQITQVHWNRFRGSLGGAAGSSGGYEPGMEADQQPILSDQGYAGSGFGMTGSADGAPGPGLRLPGASVFPMPGGPGPGVPGPLGFPMPGMGPGSPAGQYNPYGMGGGTLTAVTDSQLTSGLVEITVYGLVSLYEKYGSKPAEGGTETASTP